MSLKDNAELVKMYAMVNVQQYNIVATGSTVAECESNYIKLLSQNGLASGQSASTEVEGVIAEIRTAVIEGNSWYYFRLEGDDFYYSISAAASERAVILSVGDRVKIMRVQNKLDRFDLVLLALRELPGLGNRGGALAQEMKDKLVEHKQYIAEYGVDLPEITEWKWHD